MRSQGLRAGRLQLKLQLVHRVRRVSWRDDAASPVRSPRYNGGINAVRSEQSEHVALLPLEDGLQALAEVQRGVFE